MFLLNLTTVLVSSYAGYFSYHSIIHAQHYESKTERAARHSSTADDQLWQSRKTLGAGAAACILSLLSSLYALFAAGGGGGQSALRFLLYVVNVPVCLGARHLIADFWGRKAKVPGLKHLNEAIAMTDRLRVWLIVLAGSWALSCVLGLIGV